MRLLVLCVIVVKSLDNFDFVDNEVKKFSIPSSSVVVVVAPPLQKFLKIQFDMCAALR